MKIRWITSAIIVLAFAAPLISKIPTRRDVGTVDVQKPSKRDIKTSVLASGNFAYEIQANLSPEILGRVTEILVKEGQRVEKGQVVLRIDDKQYKAAVDQQQATVMTQRTDILQQELMYANEEKQFKRISKVFDNGYVSGTQFDQEKYSLDTARLKIRSSKEALDESEAELAQSKEILTRTEVRAPMSGTVISVNIKVGEIAVPSSISIEGSSLLVIADSMTMQAQVNVDEADISNVQQGQAVMLYAPTHPNAPLHGVVKIIALAPTKTENPYGASASPQGKTYAVKVELEDAEKNLVMPGMTCRAEIYTATSHKSLSLPVEAILGGDDGVAPDQLKSSGESVKAGKSYVFVVDGTTVSKRMIETGISDDRYQEISDGLNDSEQVVVGPHKLLRSLKDGDSVKVRQAKDVRNEFD